MWILDEEDVDYTMIFCQGKRCGVIGVEWDYSSDYFVEGRIWLLYTTPKHRNANPWRIVIADLKDSCRFNTRMIGVPHRLAILVDRDDYLWLGRMKSAGFMETSRDGNDVLMQWPNDDHD